MTSFSIGKSEVFLVKSVVWDTLFVKEKYLNTCHVLLFWSIVYFQCYFLGGAIQTQVWYLSEILWQGGGWCNNRRTCVYRKTTRRGSSKFMEKAIPFTGILSNNAQENPGFHSTETIWSFWTTPIMLKRICLTVWLILFLMIADFFNWNRVKIRYCDGASFTGDSEDKVNLQNWNDSQFYSFFHRLHLC